MTTKSFAKEAPSKESKRWPLWVAASATLATVFVGLFFYFFVCSSSSPFHAIQNKHGGFLIASLFCTIALSSSFLAPLMLLIKFLQYKEKKYRLKLVLACAAIGAFFVTGFVYFVETSSSKIACIIKDNDLLAPIFLLIVSAPMSLYLWSCRNEDKLKQIDQSDEQSRFDDFSNAINLLVKRDNKHANAVGLRILARIKNKGKAFHAEIDMATSGANLESTDLTGADLTNTDLRRATLENANLLDVNLTAAKLSQATLRGTNLTGSILKEAELKNAWIGIYNSVKYQEFSREGIETHLRQDWKEKASEKDFDAFLPILVRTDEEKKEIYYFAEKATLASGASSNNPRASSPNPSGTLDGDSDPYKIGGAPSDGTVYDFSGIIDNAPLDSPVDYCNRGLAKMKAGDYDGAISDFSDAINLDPNNGPARRYRGVARMRKSKRGKK